MELKFVKMHGLGNDFILIDSLIQKIPPMSPFCKKYSDRRRGIGFDQALVLSPSDRADFRMEIYNADGSRVEMCGNGIRCLARYIWDRGLSNKDTLTIETLAGLIRPERDGDMVRVDMGEPILDGPSIPVNIEGEIRNHPVTIDDRFFYITCVSMGNPHAVIFLDNIDVFPVARYGPLLEHHALFPKRANVEFVRIINTGEIAIRVWERGAGETLACGTGACASAVASNLNGYTGRKVSVHLPGGDLLINWSEEDNHVYMTGPAVEVYEGKIKTEGSIS